MAGFAGIYLPTHAQQDHSSSLIAKKISQTVSKRSKAINTRIAKPVRKILRRISKEIERLQKKNPDNDISPGEEIDKHGKVNVRYSNKNELTSFYFPALDTTLLYLKFLRQKLADDGSPPETMSASNDLTTVLDNFFYLMQERNAITSQVETLAATAERNNINPRLKKLRKHMNRYNDLVEDYRQIITDPQILKDRGRQLLHSDNAFKNFVRENGMLSGVFNLPGHPSDPAALAMIEGLQTRAFISDHIVNNWGITGREMMEKIKKNSPIGKPEIPRPPVSFREDTQKEMKPQHYLPFSKQWKWTWDIQPFGGMIYLPYTTIVSVNAGYRLKDQGIIGVGMSGNLGMQKRLDNLNFSYRGLGLRVLTDWKLKRSIWLSGVYEMNYDANFHADTNFENHAAWNRVGLLGISKLTPVKNRFFDETKCSLLWDFLSSLKNSGMQPLVVRIGYSLK
jgi:hypothetical protein